MIPLSKIKQYINPYNFQTDCTVPIRQQKQDYQDQITKYKEEQKLKQQQALPQPTAAEINITSLDVRNCELQIELLCVLEARDLASLLADIEIGRAVHIPLEQIKEFLTTTHGPDDLPHSSTPYDDDLKRLLYDVNITQHPTSNDTVLIAANATFEQHFETKREETIPPIFEFDVSKQSDILVCTTLQSGIISVPEFSQLQKQDAYCLQILKLLSDGDSETLDHYLIKDDVLIRVDRFLPKYYKESSEETLKKTTKYKARLVLPECLIQPVASTLHYGHATKIGSHAPKTRVVQTMTETYFRPNLKAIVYDIIKRCRSCQLSYATTRPRKGISLHNAACEPRQLVHLDLAISLPITHPDKYCHVLICVDNYSKFVVAVPLKNKSGKAILEAFKLGWVSCMGLPAYIKSDAKRG